MDAEKIAELEKELTGMLLSFVDFIYAVVFGLIVQEVYEKIVFAENVAVITKAANILLVLGVFYFLAWDWLHGRLLTLKNPYLRYRRFFIEIVIAFCGYGAARQAVEMRQLLLLYLALILVLGALWAHYTLKEHPRSEDKDELRNVTISHVAFSIAGVVALGAWHWFLLPRAAKPNTLVQIGLLLFFGWFFIFIYELLLVRPVGILSGPGVPFVNNRQLNWIRNLIDRFRTWEKEK